MNTPRGGQSENSSELELRLQTIVTGDTSAHALDAFYKCFLESSVLVPRREQTIELPSVADYPSTFTDVLGVADRDDTYVPVFSSPDDVKDWFPQDMELHTLRGSELCRRVPEGWWITLNPGSDFGKEFSPWEVQKLRDGAPGIEEIVDDQQVRPEGIRFRAATAEETTSILALIQDEIVQMPNVTALYYGVQDLEDGERKVFGAICTDGDDGREPLNALFQRHLIGDDPFELHVGTSLDESAALSIFRLYEPIFGNPPSEKSQSLVHDWATKLLNFFRK